MVGITEDPISSRLDGEHGSRLDPPAQLFDLARRQFSVARHPQFRVRFPDCRHQSTGIRPPYDNRRSRLPTLDQVGPRIEPQTARLFFGAMAPNTLGQQERPNLRFKETEPGRDFTAVRCIQYAWLDAHQDAEHQDNCGWSLHAATHVHSAPVSIHVSAN